MQSALRDNSYKSSYIVSWKILTVMVLHQLWKTKWTERVGLLLGLLFWLCPILPLNGATKNLISDDPQYEVSEFSLSEHWALTFISSSDWMSWCSAFCSFLPSFSWLNRSTSHLALCGRTDERQIGISIAVHLLQRGDPVCMNRGILSPLRGVLP